jgi:hypothetical protein
MVRVSDCDEEDTLPLRQVIAPLDGVRSVDFACRNAGSTASIRSSAEWHREMYLRSLKATQPTR